ncbi:MAG: NAD(P)-binding domain-containing protein [Acidimicrobiales bacterium]
MSHVSVIGAGALGSALIEGLVAAGSDVTVWNRTSEKLDTLSGPQVRAAPSVQEALAASPLTIVAVSDHDVCRQLIEEAEADLDDKVVASTSFATAEQAGAFAEVVAGQGGHCLDLAVAAYPSEVRSRNGWFIVSGDSGVYERHRHQFDQLGRTSYVSDTPGSAFISEMAVLLGYFPMAVGLLQGVRVCEQFGLPQAWFDATVSELYPRHIQSLLQRAHADGDLETGGVEASIDVWGDAAAEYADALRELGLDAGMYDALHRLFNAASEAGQGSADWIRIAGHVAGR